MYGSTIDHWTHKELVASRMKDLSDEKLADIARLICNHSSPSVYINEKGLTEAMRNWSESVEL